MKLQKYLNEAKEALSLYDVNTAGDVVMKIEREVKLPFIKGQFSTLGGPENVSVLFRGSLDPQETWSNNIFENSRYFHMRFERNGRMEMFSKGYTIKTKFRKAKAKSLDDMIKRTNDWIKKVNKE